jgi:FkbM family methyltransferase
MTQDTDCGIPSEAVEDWGLIARGEYDIPLERAPRTVLDIGAHVGMFSAWARKRWPDAQIIAYEPRPENADRWESNLEGVQGVTLNRFAVRGFGGVSMMRRGLNSLCGSFHYNDGTGEMALPHVAADDVPSCEFVKIDAEGSEVEIIEKLDLTSTLALACEAHTVGDADKIKSIMFRRGFVLREQRGNAVGCAILKFIRRDQVGRTGQHTFVAVPIYSSVCYEFMQCYTRLAVDTRNNITLRPMCGDSLVARARNTLTAEFLRSDATDLLFIDSDLVFSADHVARLLSHDEDVVGGFYPKKQEGPLRWVCNMQLHETKPRQDGLQEVRYMGTGFLRIKRRVFERMIEAHGSELAYHPDNRPEDTEWDFWSCGVYVNKADGFRRYLSEDWYFCQRWLDLGGKVWGDTGIILKHVGQAVYPLLTQRGEITRPADEAPANSTDTR